MVGRVLCCTRCWYLYQGGGGGGGGAATASCYPELE